ncbi:hypothetical protein K504DRAFT_534079 [Pleomassaria siparia CBS 279.74]|uniref:Uncharacterized protein n=1 Tax=Pleomassaria siparia CBS 279.74 TaxID=1314801 RepID=A0A6G1KBE6_9PLEO|nr:hypothetical protein K504DRAFT_534079 [Pleomassaria siparia CBS 279.74]
MQSTTIRPIPLRIAASQADISACNQTYPADAVKSTLLSISHSLLATESRLTLWQQPTFDRFSVSLRMLHDRFERGCPAPSSPIVPQSGYTSSPQSPYQVSTPQTTPMTGSLSDCEDMYYALLWTIQSHHQVLTVRLENTFNVPSDTLYFGGPTISEFFTTLCRFWNDLNDLGLVKTLDEAIRSVRIARIHDSIMAQWERGDIRERQLAALLSDLDRQGHTVKGLAWINGWAPSMIAAELGEKYRALLEAEKAGMKGKKKKKVNNNDLRYDSRMEDMLENHDSSDERWPAKANKVQSYGKQTRNTMARKERNWDNGQDQDRDVDMGPFSVAIPSGTPSSGVTATPHDAQDP